jgi:DNA-directed RNA polymerase alpha subunit
MEDKAYKYEMEKNKQELTVVSYKTLKRQGVHKSSELIS